MSLDATESDAPLRVANFAEEERQDVRSRTEVQYASTDGALLEDGEASVLTASPPARRLLPRAARLPQSPLAQSHNDRTWTARTRALLMRIDRGKLGGYMSFVNIICALGACTLYIVESYHDLNQDVTLSLESVFFAVFVFDYAFNVLIAEHPVAYTLSGQGIVDLLSWLPGISIFVPSLRGKGYTGMLSFLRTLRIIRILKAQRSLFARLFDPRMPAGQMLNLVLWIFSIIFMGAGVIYAIEQIQVDNGVVNPFVGSPLTFFDSAYLVIVTITTVGFGDITPNSSGSKAAIVLVMIVAFMIIPYEVSKLTEMVSRYRTTLKYRRPFVPSEGAPYIVLCGSVSARNVRSFLYELYHKDHGEHNTTVMIAGPTNPGGELLSMIKLPKFQNLVRYYRSALLDETAFEEISLSKANALFVLADPFQSHVQDYEAALRLQALAHVQNCADLPVYFQGVRRSAFLDAVRYSVPRRPCVAIYLSGLRLAILAQSCFADAVAPFFSNLIQCSSGSAESGEASSVLQEYEQGRDKEIYRLPFPRSLWNLALRDVAAVAFHRSDIIFFAVGKPKGSREEIHLFDPQGTVERGSYAYVFAENESEAEKFFDEFDRRRSGAEDAAGERASASPVKPEPSPVSSVRKERGLMKKLSIRRISMQDLAGPMQTATTLIDQNNSERRIESEKFFALNSAIGSETPEGDLSETTGDATRPKGVPPAPPPLDFDGNGAGELLGRLSPGTALRRVDSQVIERFRRDPPSLKEALIRDARLIGLKDHIIVSGGMDADFADFLAPLRGRAALASGITFPVVLFLPYRPSDDWWSEIADFTEVYIIVGDTSRRTHLARAGIKSCHRFVVLHTDITADSMAGTAHQATSDPALPPAYRGASRFRQHASIVGATDECDDSVYAEQVLADSAAVCAVVTARTINPKVAVTAELAFEKNAVYLGSEKPFVSGEAFHYGVLDSLLAQSFFNPYAVGVLRLLLGIDSGSSGSFLVPVQPSEACIGMRFGLFFWCALQHDMLPVAIIRAPAGTGAKFPFVYAAPSASAVLRRGDKVLALVAPCTELRRGPEVPIFDPQCPAAATTEMQMSNEPEPDAEDASKENIVLL